MIPAALLLPLLALSGSFPAVCTGEASPLERLICQDPGREQRQESIQELYDRALGALPAAAAAAQRQRQDEWLRMLAHCTSSEEVPACIDSQQARRSVELNIVLGRAPTVATATYLCPGHESTPLTATYFRTDPAAARLSYQQHEAIVFAAPAASGARYSARGVEIWEHQGVARFIWQGEELSCPRH